MSTTLGLGLQRSSSAVSPGGAGTPRRLKNLPVIEHPMSRLGDRNGLTVRGGALDTNNSAITLSRSQTDVGVKCGDNKQKLPDNCRLLNYPPGVRPKTQSAQTQSQIAVDISPPFKYKEKPYQGLLPDIDGQLDTVAIPDRVDKFPKVGYTPALPPIPSIEEQEEFLKGPGKPCVRSKEYSYQPRTTQELIDLIRDKFGAGFVGIRHLFRANDPTGKGAVSREALQKILYTLCGYITPDQYSKLLKATNLDKKTVHFEMFVDYFKETEKDKKGWISALQTAGMQTGEALQLESYLRRNDLTTYDPYTSMPFSDAIFKEKCCSKNFDARKIFPSSVFDGSGLILPPQLREAYSMLGIFMTDDDFNKLWQRYDKENTGALHRDTFFRKCGINSQGRPRQTIAYTPRGAAYPRQRPHSEIGHTNGIDTSTKLKKILKKEDVEKLDLSGIKNDAPGVSDVQTEQLDPVVKETTAKSNPTQRIPAQVKKQKAAPKLDNIIDCLHYKFEELYQSMLTAFKLFDFLNDGFVSKIDMRRVLQEFGFPVSSLSFESFLKKNAIKVIKGQLGYRDFLTKFQRMSLSAIIDRACGDTDNMANGDMGSGDGLGADALENKLIDRLHADFIHLLSHFRKLDRYNLLLVPSHEFRSAIEKRLGYTMTESQWKQLKIDVGHEKAGLISYGKFFELFDIMPGSWNVDGRTFQVAKVTHAEMQQPSPVDRLMECAKTVMAVPPGQPTDPTTRSLEEIKKKIDDMFRIKFHTFDKHFKTMDRRQTGRLSRWQFKALLKLCGLVLTPMELDRIWSTLNVNTDDMISYKTLVMRHFGKSKTQPEEKENIVFAKSESDVWHETKTNAWEDTTELVETARRIHRERKEEQAMRDNLARKKEQQQEEPDEETKPEAPVVAPETPRSMSSMSSVSRTALAHPPGSHASMASIQSIRTKSLLIKIRSDVINNWEELKAVFNYMDRSGSSFISAFALKESMTHMQFNITDEEKTELCRRFDTDKNGMFNYMAFMKCYAQRPNTSRQPKPQHTPTPSPPPQPVYSKFTHKLQTQLLRAHTFLRRAFRKLDEEHKGYLKVSDFKNALKDMNITYTNEDFYHIMAEFDLNMEGHVKYDQFLKTLLNISPVAKKQPCHQTTLYPSDV